ncbi:hypothetical protein ACSV4D_16280 [Flavobacterium sp. ARAG 55.4]|uniref:hypothetical protein n=1 Tax=Flavobacterium sp. ARAG 55.4 TaxID=3451357 RepID=UPI003F448359
MKKLSLLALLFTAIHCIAQSKTDKLTKPIIEEGKKLYQSEMASWYGTDIFLAKYKDHEKIGGYFSYSENDNSKCIFFSKEENPKVIGTIIFNGTFEVSKATALVEERTFTPNELDYYTLRENAKKALEKDTLIKSYNNSKLNLIPLISNNEKKVYILTGPNVNGVVLLGNDYLLNFDKNNNFISRKALHKNLIPIQYKKDETEVQTVHNHQAETGDFITATDICTLMLYGKFTNWKNHIVLSKNYASVWNCKTEELNVLPAEAFTKIFEKTEK